jgi:hypothetical protein
VSVQLATLQRLVELKRDAEDVALLKFWRNTAHALLAIFAAKPEGPRSVNWAAESAPAAPGRHAGVGLATSCRRLLRKAPCTLESGGRIVPGKAALLESVRDTGSISAAARAIDMDYKRAWLLIDSLNRAFDTAVVERAAGGAGDARRAPRGRRR